MSFNIMDIVDGIQNATLNSKFDEILLNKKNELHELFKEFPPCPETLTPNVEWMSNYQKEYLTSEFFTVSGG